MINLEIFPDHLKTIKKSKWKKLFNLLPEIERCIEYGSLNASQRLENGTYTFPTWEWSEMVNRFFIIVSDLNLAPSFDWMNWIEGREILEDEKRDYNTLDKITLCKLLTIIIRKDRFYDGFLIICFKDKTVFKILHSLQGKV